MLLRPFDAADASVGLGHDSESMTLEQLTRGSSKVAVVVDEKDTTGHEKIVPAHTAMRSVAGSTLSSR